MLSIRRARSFSSQFPKTKVSYRPCLVVVCLDFKTLSYLGNIDKFLIEMCCSIDVSKVGVIIALVELYPCVHRHVWVVVFAFVKRRQRGKFDNNAAYYSNFSNFADSIDCGNL